MGTSINDLLDLRLVTDDVERGYLFEQGIREVVPWDFRPPLAMRARGEQLDAFYEWNSWHFLVESKAKRKAITRGSHDWEDFELKVRKRRGSCIGLYCSLFPISESAIDAARDLNTGGLPTIILGGEVWDELAISRVSMTDLMRYMVLHVKVTHAPCPPQLSKVQDWCYDRGRIEKEVQSLCRSISGPFLRRNILLNHSQIYVEREIDNRIEQMTNLLRPSVLAQDRKSKLKQVQNQDKLVEYTALRQLPAQICLIRDGSGAGKTTLSLEIALTTDAFYGCGRAASEDNVDETLSMLEKIGPNFGLSAFVTLNRPIVFVVDSLDEALNLPGKHSQILGLFRSLDHLNATARGEGLIAFPILLVFTIREDYWRQWETIFEGQHAQVFLKQFSRFEPDELSTALRKYAKAYHFVIESDPSSEAATTLALPFNLQVFAQANEYFETVSFTDVFDEKVLQLYFHRKRDNIIKRRIAGLTGEALIKLLSEFAMQALRGKRRVLSRKQAIKIIRERFPTLYPVADEVLIACRSEDFLSHDPQKLEELGFRHSRFMEYLIAQYIVREYDEGRGDVGDLTGEVFKAGTVSMYRVHDFVRFICQSEYPQLFDRMMDVYAKSDEYMRETLGQIRAGIGVGVPLSEHDASVIRRSLNSSSPQVAWNSFFALAAKRNAIDDKWVLEAFEVAWKANAANVERWRILDRMLSRNLFLSSAVLERVLDSHQMREWEFTLGTLLTRSEIKTVWQDLFPEFTRRAAQALEKRKGEDWEQIRRLWKILIEDGEYVLGDINSG